MDRVKSIEYRVKSRESRVERPESGVKKRIGVGAIHELPLQVSRKTTQSESATPGYQQNSYKYISWSVIRLGLSWYVISGK
jgi:hypothetical protein